ncbi:MAG: tetratricopeptide repeat protein, partial [Acidobacteriaceae bacterium]|nr:tetratricopeptide repeat protein [Acidobacteriaceae bacterium]
MVSLRSASLLLMAFWAAFAQTADTWKPEDRTFVEQHFAEARSAEQASDFARAATEYDTVLHRFPRELPELYQNAGIAYYLQRDYSKAIDRFQAGLRLKNGMVGAHLFLGASYVLSGRPKPALPHLLLARQDHVSLETENYLGLAYSSLGQYRTAAEYLRRCLELSSEKEKYLSLLLQTYTKWAEQTGAQCVAEFPHSVHTRLMQAEILDRKKLYELGAQEYLQAAVSDPFYAPTFFLLGRDLKRIGVESSAQLAFARYRALLPGAGEIDLPAAERRAIPPTVGDSFDYESPLRNLPAVDPSHRLPIPLVDSELNQLIFATAHGKTDDVWKEVADQLARSQWGEAIRMLHLIL